MQLLQGFRVSPSRIRRVGETKKMNRGRFPEPPGNTADDQSGSFRFMKYHMPAPITAMTATAIGSR